MKNEKLKKYALLQSVIASGNDIPPECEEVRVTRIRIEGLEMKLKNCKKRKHKMRIKAEIERLRGQQNGNG